MPDDEYEWQRSSDSWGRGRGDASPVNHYEFFARIEPIEKKLDVLHDKLEDLEERLVEERAKQVVADLFTTAVGRFTLLVITLIATIVVTRFYDFP